MNFTETHSPHRASIRCLRIRSLLLLAATGLSGCISDSTLLQENSAIALRSARIQARSDLDCEAATVTMMSEQEVPGAPWGFLYSDYRIQAAGCGRSAIYRAECRDRQLCDMTRETP